MFYSDTSVEKPSTKYAVGDFEWRLTFEHEGFPVTISGNSSTRVATVCLGGQDSEVHIAFCINTENIGINDLVMQAKEMLNDYFVDYRRGVN